MLSVSLTIFCQIALCNDKVSALSSFLIEIRYKQCLLKSIWEAVEHGSFQVVFFISSCQVLDYNTIYCNFHIAVTVSLTSFIISTFFCLSTILGAALNNLQG